MKRLRIYLDTSVVGGCFDAEFSGDSEALLNMARRGEVTILVSDVLLDELAKAPEEVASLLEALPGSSVEYVRNSAEAVYLCDRYLEANVVGPASKNDAHHVALATVAHADLIVSWNFRHVVHFDKIRGFNAVNLQQGYLQIDIRTPREVV
ncbi:MAG TPA: PIN domain-containing protein [Candidatus Hydrogenedentes bacterium]|nr:PIN domain-containing protein [Candidatus Hydrogenedentota bacterium]